MASPRRLAEDGNADLHQAAAQGVLFAAAQRLAHAQEDGAAVGDQGGVEDIDRVRALRLGLGVLDDLGARLAQHLSERIMLAPGRLQVRPGRVMPPRRIGIAEGLVRPADEDPAEGSGHALAAVLGGHGGTMLPATNPDPASLDNPEFLRAAGALITPALFSQPPSLPTGRRGRTAKDENGLG